MNIKPFNLFEYFTGETLVKKLVGLLSKTVKNGAEPAEEDSAIRKAASMLDQDADKQRIYADLKSKIDPIVYAKLGELVDLTTPGINHTLEDDDEDEAEYANQRKEMDGDEVDEPFAQSYLENFAKALAEFKFDGWNAAELVETFSEFKSEVMDFQGKNTTNYFAAKAFVMLTAKLREVLLTQNTL